MCLFNRSIKIRIMLILVVFFVGIVFSSTLSALAEPSLREVTVLLEWVPNTNHTGMYVALEKGFYQEEGLQVDIIQPEEGGAAPFIAAGQGEFGISHQEQMTFARTADEPLPVVAIAAILQHNTSGFASPIEKGIIRPKDFEGKKYGGWGSPIEEATIKALMDIDGADYNKTEIVNIGAIDFFAAVKEYVDYTWIYYGWDGVSSEVKKFPINFIYLREYDRELDFYTPVIITREQLLLTEPEMVKKFLRATEKGYLFSIENPEEAVRILLKYAPEIDQDIAIASQKYLAGEYLADAPYWGKMEKERWEGYAHWLYQRGLIDRKLDVGKVFDNSFLPGEGNQY